MKNLKHYSSTAISVCFLLLIPAFSFASFTLSGTTITQTGTDTSLAGLSGISGVSVIQVLDQDIYILTDRALVIQGTLTTSTSKTESLIFDQGSTLNVQGTFNFGHDYVDSDSTIQEFAGIKSKMAFDHSGGAWSNPRFIVSGTFNGINTDLDVSQTTVRTDGSGHFKLKNSSFYSKSGAGNQFRVQGNTADVTFDNVKAIGISYQFFNYSGTNSLTRYNPIDTRDGLVRGGGGIFVHTDLENFLGNALEVGGLNQVLWLKNPKQGCDLITQSWQAWGTQGHLIATGTINLDIENSSGTKLENVKVFAQSVATTGNDVYAGEDSKYDLNQQSTYFESTNSSGVLATDLEVVLGEYYVNNTQTDQTLTRRNGRSDDLWTYNLYHYNYNPLEVNQDMKGIGKKDVFRILANDPNITESNSATVAAYTTIDNLDELYDYTKYWKGLNTTNIVVPTASDLLVTTDGNTLSLPNNWSLVVDATASSVFNVNVSSETITIKSSVLKKGEKATEIKTSGSGTITTANGATIEHGFIDSTGSNVFLDLDWNENTGVTVEVENLDDNSIISTATATETYKGHYIIPSPEPTNGVRLNLTIVGETVAAYQNTIPKGDLNFTRLEIVFQANGERQEEMLFLTRKLLQKTEGINAALNGTTPTLTDNTTVASSTTTASNETQVAILTLLRRILLKTSANHSAFDE